VSNDLEYCYTLATSKGGAPAARTMSALNDWCVARGSGALTTAAAMLAFISSYSGAGSASYTSPGTSYFTVPFYATLTAEVWSGSGAGGAGLYVNPAGGAGGSSYFDTLAASGGLGGQPANYSGAAASGGLGGAGYNGDTNLSGTSGGNATGGGNEPGSPGAGGSDPTGRYSGGGSGGDGSGCDPKGCTYSYGGGGGGPGYTKKTYAPGALATGAVLPVIVGAGGGGDGEYDTGYAGTAGRILISWT
jgi:hypothetical protein